MRAEIAYKVAKLADKFGVIHRGLELETRRNLTEKRDARAVFFNVRGLVCGNSHAVYLVRVNEISLKGSDIILYLVGILHIFELAVVAVKIELKILWLGESVAVDVQGQSFLGDKLLVGVVIGGIEPDLYLVVTRRGGLFCITV